MSRSHKTLGFLFVAVFGIYGCAKGPTTASRPEASPGEAKVQRLEEDFRAAAAARDQYRHKLFAAEEKNAQLQKQHDQARASVAEATAQRDALLAERDALKAELKTRTSERDTLATQYDAFRKNIKELLGQAETTRNTSPSRTSPVLVGSQPVAPTTGSSLSN